MPGGSGTRDDWGAPPPLLFSSTRRRGERERERERESGVDVVEMEYPRDHGRSQSNQLWCGAVMFPSLSFPSQPDQPDPELDPKLDPTHVDEPYRAWRDSLRCR